MADKKISALTAASLPLAGTEVLPIVQGGATVKVSSDNLTTKNFRSNATDGILQVAGPGAGTTRVMNTPNANFTVARTDAAQTFTGIQVFTNAGNENIRLSDGSANSTLQQNSAALYFNVNDSSAVNGTFFWRSSNALTTVMTLNGANGNLTANTGNFVVGTAGRGIDFSANTHAAGMTSELLNDYEEGTFTPVLSSSGTPPTVASYLNQYGAYTKIGNRVFATVNIRANVTNAGTGHPVITGLPYAANANCNNGPTWGLATLLTIGGVQANFVSGTSINLINCSYLIATDYVCFSIMYEV